MPVTLLIRIILGIRQDAVFGSHIHKAIGIPCAVLHEKKVTGVRVENVKTGERRTIDCDALFIAIGRTPETAIFAGQAELDKGGYLVADETTRTNIAGVFAVGDVRVKEVRQIVTATADGATAAHYIEEYLH